MDRGWSRTFGRRTRVCVVLASQNVCIEVGAGEDAEIIGIGSRDALPGLSTLGFVDDAVLHICTLT
jgi:hypothetical protein